MSFLDIAMRMAERGVPVIPIPTREKGPKISDWPHQATTSAEQIAAWNVEYPDGNFGCVAKPDGYWMLDCDSRTLDDRIAAETGMKIPDTFTVQSRKGLHFYWKQTDASRAMGNRKRQDMFDAQVVDKQVVGPGSIHPSGVQYKIVDASPIVEAPDWLIDWIKANSASDKKPASKEFPELHDDFDPDDFFRWYEEQGAFEVTEHREWKGNDCCITNICILAGHKHTGSWHTGFIVGDNVFGYHCESPDCTGLGISDVLAKLRELGFKPYPGRIWADREGGFAVDEAQLPTTEAVLTDDEEAEEVEIVTDAPEVVDDTTILSILKGPGPTVHKLSEMPENCTYGWIAQKAHEMEMPLGYAYPAMLTAYAAQMIAHPSGIRPTLYCALIGPVHSGKSVAINRAIDSIIYREHGIVKKTVTGSDRGLINAFGGKKEKKKKGEPEDIIIPKVHLLKMDELRNLMGKMNIQGSSLAPTLCTLWSDDEASSADKTGEHVAMVKLSILGGLKAKDPEEFAETFGRETMDGLYDRFIYGLAPKGWEYEPWEPKPERRFPKGINQVPKLCFDTLRTWREEGRAEGKDRGRLGEIALRVAVITAAANHEDTIGEACMSAALEFIEWQEAIRESYKPSVSEGTDSRCTEAVLNAIKKYSGSWVKWTRLAQNRDWYKKFGASTLGRTKDSLVKQGVLIEQSEEDEDGKKHKTGCICLLKE